MPKCFIKINVLCQIFTCVHLQSFRLKKCEAYSQPEQCNQKITVITNFAPKLYINESRVKFLHSSICLNAGLIWLYLTKYISIVKLYSTTWKNWQKNWFPFAVGVLGYIDENLSQWKFAFAALCVFQVIFIFICLSLYLLYVFCTFLIFMCTVARKIRSHAECHGRFRVYCGSDVAFSLLY